MSLTRKLLRLLSLVCGILLIAISPLLIFHTEFEEPTFGPISGSYAREQFWIHIYSLIFGLFLFIVGLVLIVASYYHHDELHLVDKI